MRPLLIIITGPAGAGKTTLGQQIAADLRLPFLHKDGIKERLHDGLGTPDLETSRRMGRVSFDVLYWAVEALLRAGNSAVVEANFAREFASLPLQALLDASSARCFQIVCSAPPAVLRERMLARRAAGERHAAHHDTQAIAGFPADYAALTEEYGTLNVSGETIRLDTTDFNKVDTAVLCDRLRLRLSGRDDCEKIGFPQ